jgi:phospholipid/cholesterol/gamma-HCH transport system permease protein
MLARTPGLSWLSATFEFVGECTLLVVDAFRRLFRPPFETREFVKQMAFIGVSSVPIVSLTTFSSGAVLALYLAKFLVQYGVGGLSGATIGLSVVREIAPVISAIMVAARCGSAMSAQIGTMAVTEQIDALRSLNVHPTKYLVIPRIAASVLMVPVLGLVGIYAGITGGYLVSVYLHGVSSGAFLNSLRVSMQPSDVTNCLLKSAVFGLIVAVVSCQQGLRAEGGAEGVGKTTTRSVVLGMVLIYVADYFLSQAMFL